MLKFKIEGVPYEVPEFISIESYSKIFKVKDFFNDDYMTAKLINIVSGAPLKDLLEGEADQIQYIAAYISLQFPQKDNIPFVDRFEIDGVEYGFFSNWKDLTFAEFVDMDTIINKKPEELLDLLHILAAVMYRPIISEESIHNFKIEEYDVEKMKVRAELFKKRMDVKVILGAQFFFIKFAEKFSNYSQTFSMKKLNWIQKIRMIWLMWRMIYNIRSKRRSDGFWSSTKFLTMILQNTK